MNGYVSNIEKLTVENTYFRQVLYTGNHSQLVLMCLKPKEEIGMEKHATVDQFFRIESGKGKLIMADHAYEIGDGTAFVVPAGTFHNIINTSDSEFLKLYTVYSPANHPDGTVHKTKAEADEYERKIHS